MGGGVAHWLNVQSLEVILKALTTYSGSKTGPQKSSKKGLQHINVGKKALKRFERKINAGPATTDKTKRRKKTKTGRKNQLNRGGGGASTLKKKETTKDASGKED